MAASHGGVITAITIIPCRPCIDGSDEHAHGAPYPFLTLASAAVHVLAFVFVKKETTFLIFDALSSFFVIDLDREHQHE
jgi:hypothetical protein